MAKRVLAFGTFDGLHAGHRAFLKQARSCGEHLTVVLPRDHIVRELKGREPRIRLEERIAALEALPAVDKAVGGDARTGSWRIVEELRPDVIALGWDQHRLRDSLERHLAAREHPPELRVMDHYPCNKNRD